MRAIVIAQTGGPEVLELRQVEEPVPGRGEVRVRVRATGVNRADLLQCLGRYPAPPDAPQDIPGLEFAGEIDACGAGPHQWKDGDRVFGLTGGGSYAEKLLVPSRGLARIPDRLSFEEAAATPESFITAYDALVSQAGLAAGETVLVHAVGSGVGTAALQLAQAIGARCLGTARTRSKLERAKELGLEEGILVTEGSFAGRVLSAVPDGVDVILNLVGGDYLSEDLACAGSRARIMMVGLLAGRSAEIDLRAVLDKRLTIRGTVLRARPLEEKIQTVRIFARHVVPLLASGAVRPVVDRTFPLADAGQAHSYVSTNSGFGKVVLTV